MTLGAWRSALGSEQQVDGERAPVAKAGGLELADRPSGRGDPILDLRLEPLAAGVVIGLVPPFLRLDE